MKGISFVTDEKNRKKAVIIDLKIISERQNEIEDLLDIIVAESRKDEPKTKWEEVKLSLKKRGKL